MTPAEPVVRLIVPVPVVVSLTLPLVPALKATALAPVPPWIVVLDEPFVDPIVTAWVVLVPPSAICTVCALLVVPMLIVAELLPIVTVPAPVVPRVRTPVPEVVIVKLWLVPPTVQLDVPAAVSVRAPVEVVMEEAALPVSEIAPPDCVIPPVIAVDLLRLIAVAFVVPMPSAVAVAVSNNGA